MEYIRLGDLYSITKGKKVEALEDNNSNVIRYIQIDDLRNNDNIKYCSNNNKYVIANENDLIIAWDGANAGTIGYGLNGAIGSTLAKLSTNSKKIYTPFIGRYMQYQSKSLRDRCTGATIPHIQRSVLEEILIPKYYIDIQKRISMVLDKAQELIDKRKEQIEACDELIKSLFYHMFGDPVKNEKGWELIKLSELADIKIGPFGTLLHKEDYITGGHALVNPSHINDGKICCDSNLTISDEKYSQLDAYHLKKGDVVLGRRGEMGRCAVVENDGLICGTGSLLIRNKCEISSEILQKIISFPSYKKVIEDKAVGQTMLNLNVPIVSEFMIPKISIDAQKKYYEYVKQINKSKIKMQQSLTELENNFNSLMQRAFKGELF